ncbi:MAG: hypothetical protein HZA88_22325 [Verrucomicrobia bacterium]|nr:hypothetical protein [Verrucomicrobiota bacterium]
MILVAKTIEAAWTEGAQQKLISFWSARRFLFSDTSAAPFVAKRGHILWNLISYDMTRLRADLTIASSTPDRIDLRMKVSSAFQQITDWNRAYLDLEMATCESFLLRNDLREAEWTEFMKAYRKAAIIWTLTFSIGGRRMPHKTDSRTNS